MKVVLIRFKGADRRDIPLRGTSIVLGRRDDCQLHIPLPDVSRRHCQIDITPNGPIVRDLGSTNGTYVNDKRIAETQLKPGDRLTVGALTFIVQIDGKPAQVRPEQAAAEPEPEFGPPVGAGGKSAPAEADIDDLLGLDDVELTLDDPIPGLDDLGEDDELKPG